METGIAKAAKSKFGQDNEIKVIINRDSGDIEIFRKLIISETSRIQIQKLNLKMLKVLMRLTKIRKLVMKSCNLCLHLILEG